MRENKECEECGGIYFRGENATLSSWEARRYCSPSCAGRAAARRNREAKKEEARREAEFLSEALVAVELKSTRLFLSPLGASSVEEAMKESPAEFVSKATETSSVHDKLPIERELTVVRVGPNPRMLVCEYMELAQRRTCTVLVGRGAKLFMRGMKFKLREPLAQEAYLKPWPYEGKLPRLKGRW